MDTIHAPVLVACALAFSLCTDAHATTETGDGPLISVAPPPNSRPLGRKIVSEGGQQATYITSATPEGIISFYKQILPVGGWTVTDSDEGTGGKGAELRATNGPQYLALNAGGPTGMTYVKVCVWPSTPSDDHCG
jgi:hypothetical protein